MRETGVNRRSFLRAVSALAVAPLAGAPLAGALVSREPEKQYALWFLERSISTDGRFIDEVTRYRVVCMERYACNARGPLAWRDKTRIENRKQVWAQIEVSADRKFATTRIRYEVTNEQTKRLLWNARQLLAGTLRLEAGANRQRRHLRPSQVRRIAFSEAARTTGS